MRVGGDKARLSQPHQLTAGIFHNYAAGSRPGDDGARGGDESSFTSEAQAAERERPDVTLPFLQTASQQRQPIRHTLDALGSTEAPQSQFPALRGRDARRTLPVQLRRVQSEDTAGEFKLQLGKRHA